MSKRLLIAVLFLLLSLAMSGADKQRDYITYKEFSPNNGYPSKITAIYIDWQEGFVCLGSNDGVFRIGAGTLNRMYKNEDALLGLPGNIIYKLGRDKAGNMWILTDGGVAGFKAPDNFATKRIRLDESMYARSFFAADDAVYFGGVNRIWKYDYESETFSEAAVFETREPFEVDEIFEGIGGTLDLVNHSGQQALLYHPATGQISQSPFEWARDLYSSFMDSKHRIWVCEYNKGIACYDYQGNFIAEYNTSNSGLSDNVVLCFTEKDGKIWVGTGGGGINIIDPDNGRIEVLRHEAGNPDSAPGNSICALATDPAGNVWAGRTTGGAFVVISSPIHFFKTEAIRPAIHPEGIRSFHQGPNDKCIYIGTDGSGLLSFDPETEKFTAFPSTNGLKIFAIADINNDELLLSCPTKGFFRFNRRSGQTSEFSQVHDLRDYMKFGGEGACMANDAEGNLLILSKDIIKYFPSENRVVSAPLPEGMKPGHVHAVSHSNGRFIFDENGFYEIEGRSLEKISPLLKMSPSSYVSSSYYSGDGIIWLGSNDSLAFINVRTKALDYVPEKFDSEIESVLCDGRGRVWIGTNKKMYCYYTEEKRLVTIDEYLGVFPNEYKHHSKLISNTGDIYLGGVNGFVEVNKSFALPSSVEKPRISLDAVFVDGVYSGRSANISVSSSNESVRILFRTIDRDILRGRLYHFIVSGPRSVIYDAVTEESTIDFKSLPGGRYSVKAACSTKDGEWTDMEELLTFKVLRPWYARWWVILSMLVAVGLVAVLFFRHQRLKAKFTEEKSEGDDRLNFLVNVSHELRTPLTLILGPLGRVIRDIKPEDPLRERLVNVNLQAERIKVLLNTILTADSFKVGDGVMDLEKVEINKWLDGCVSSYRSEAASRGMQIITQYDGGARNVILDANKLQIVFANIMINAIRHNKENEPIKVTSEFRSAEGKVRISVIDKGPGILAANSEEIFRHAYTKTEDKSGFGVGLAYSKTIMDKHYGSIGAFNNADGEGATFWFELPA